MMSKLPRSSAGNELVPLVLHHLRLDAEFGGQGVGQVELKAGQLLRLLRIGIDVRRAAFGIRAPHAGRRLFDGLQMVRGKNQKPACLRAGRPRKKSHNSCGTKRHSSIRKHITSGGMSTETMRFFYAKTKQSCKRGCVLRLLSAERTRRHARARALPEKLLSRPAGARQEPRPASPSLALPKTPGRDAPATGRRDASEKQSTPPIGTLRYGTLRGPSGYGTCFFW